MLIPRARHETVTTFAVGEPGLKEHYDAFGYAVVRDVIPRDAIAHLMDEYRARVLPSDQPFFRQSLGRYERNRLSPHGHILDSFLDIHAYASLPTFRHAALEVFATPTLHRCLADATGQADFALMQTMLFDANTETPAHQDWWYLDTVPNGQLIAAWIALEDIAWEAGRFFVLERSHEVALHGVEEELPHSRWLELMGAWVDMHRAVLRAPALAQGDVLLWNSRTIHGSLPTLDGRCSRKSLTAHYIPSQLAFGNLFGEKLVTYDQHGAMRHFHNQPEWSPLNATKNWVKNHVFDHPRALRSLRRLRGVRLRDSHAEPAEPEA
jgi:phytanoyl-CoA hydroxylase